MSPPEDVRARALQAAYDLHRPRDAAGFPTALLAALAHAVPCDSAVLVTWDAARGHHVDAWPAGQFAHLDAAQCARLHAQDHPFVARCRRSRAVRALRLSELAPRETFQRSGLHTSLYRFLGIEHQLLMLVASPGERWRAVALNRRAQDFTEEEAQALESLWPHVTLAQRRLRRVASARGPALPGEAIDPGAAVIVIRGTGEITLCTERARRWLTDYYGGAFVGRGITLPAAMRDWALAGIAAEGRGRSLRAVRRDPLHVVRGGRCLVAELMVDHGRDQHLVHLDEVALNAPAAELEALGLTPREAEVLSWVAQGKTNREIGMILGSSGRTVQKHLEHVFQKIGVESRTAAILKAWATRPSSRR